MLPVSNHILKVVFDHLGDLDDWLELTATGPTKPFFEELPCTSFVAVVPEPAEHFFDRPGSGGFLIRHHEAL